MATWFYEYSKYLLKNPAKEIPTKPHYVVLAFSNRRIREASYGPTDPENYVDVSVIDYYAFDSKEEWEAMISDVYLEKQNSTYASRDSEIVFFRSSGRGSVDVTVNVKVHHGDF